MWYVVLSWIDFFMLFSILSTIRNFVKLEKLLQIAWSTYNCKIFYFRVCMGKCLFSKCNITDIKIEIIRIKGVISSNKRQYNAQTRENTINTLKKCISIYNIQILAYADKLFNTIFVLSSNEFTHSQNITKPLFGNKCSPAYTTISTIKRNNIKHFSNFFISSQIHVYAYAICMYPMYLCYVLVFHCVNVLLAQLKFHLSWRQRLLSCFKLSSIWSADITHAYIHMTNHTSINCIFLMISIEFEFIITNCCCCACICTLIDSKVMHWEACNPISTHGLTTCSHSNNNNSN